MSEAALEPADFRPQFRPRAVEFPEILSRNHPPGRRTSRGADATISSDPERKQAEDGGLRRKQAESDGRSKMT